MIKRIFTLSLIFLTSSCFLLKDKDAAGPFPLYGNWCGAAHPKSGYNPKPVNILDYQCKKHDICYDRYGYFNKQCDEELASNLKNIPRTSLDKDSLKIRKLIISYMKIQENRL